MWETSGLGSEDLLWSAIAFNGGIAGQREAVCGALSGAAVYLGLKHRVPLINSVQAQQAKDFARKEASQIVVDFKNNYNAIVCEKIVGIDFSDPVVVKHYRESGKWIEKCTGVVQYVLTRLYELEDKQNPTGN